MEAGERQIVGLVGSAVLARDNVLDVETHERNEVLRQPAILATTRRAPSDQGPEGAIHHDPGGTASSARALAWSTLTKSIAET